MKPAFFKHSRGVSLIELMVATFITSLISVAAFKVVIEGSQYLRLNQQALDAQRSGLALMSQINIGLQSTRRDLIATGPEGLVFASPFKEDGSVDFDPADHKLEWQKWVCYYWDSSTLSVTRREIPIAPPSSGPGIAPSVVTFSAVPSLKLVGSDVTNLQVTSISTTPPVFSINATLGTMTDTSRYGIEIHSDVSPRN